MEKNMDIHHLLGPKLGIFAQTPASLSHCLIQRMAANDFNSQMSHSHVTQKDTWATRLRVWEFTCILVLKCPEMGQKIRV